MNNKFFKFLLLISILWVGTHLFTDLKRYSKEYDGGSWKEQYYGGGWQGYTSGFGILERIFGRMTIVFS
tara:strand:- start:666 stop:872 length:207 start_codon:yes stop_codon:yes gene_type:complete